MASQQKYEKVILGIGIGLVVVAGGWTFWQNSSFAEKYASSESLPDKNTSIEGTIVADNLLQKLGADHKIARPNIGKQFFDVFAGPVLFNKKGEKTAIDIYTTAPIHKDIPNIWFIENGLDAAFRMSNAADVDSDNDGFSNYEEYLAKTNPNDASEFPNLIDKLEGISIKGKGYDLTFSSEQITPEDPIEFRADLLNARPTDKAIWKQTVKIGETFGQKPLDADRFKLTAIHKKNIKGTDVSVATVEDLKPEKQGKTYEITYGKRTPQRIIDLSAEIEVTGGPEKGSFTVVEGANFTIPGDPNKTAYFAEKIDAKAKTLTFKAAEGTETRTITFSK